MFQLHSKELPVSMYQFFMCSNRVLCNSRNSDRLSLPFVKSKKYGERSLRFSGSKIWNKTIENINIKDFSSTVSFKNFLKKQSIESYK